MFGEGRHPHIQRLYETRLAPFLTQTSLTFWKTRLHYFRNGLYYQGGMVRDPLQSIESILRSIFACRRTTYSANTFALQLLPRACGGNCRSVHPVLAPLQRTTH